ncbi:hypothetical protein FBEOM_7224 [Fusarium beomiforme]|uniref:Uncharacterized protein n=1 Tax=Fusarium beomiforme TaxID=44412 RepID=A0A9P5AIC7_9HYPO|nr:hypothetical protein FBEOM_7224 [Fusarium beomiforme]
MDTSKLAERRDKIATTLKQLQSLESRNEEQERLLKDLLPYEKETDENILAIPEEKWKITFPEVIESSENPGSDAPMSSDNESEDGFEPPAPRPSSEKKKKTKTTDRQRGNVTESEVSGGEEADKSVTINEEALSLFGTAARKTDCITLGKTKKDVYINAYGRKGARIYKIEDQPDSKCNVKELPEINGFGKQLGMLKDATGKYIYTRRHVAAVYGIAFQDDVENGVYGPDSLDPAEKGDRRWADMYVWIGWRNPDKPDMETRSWETRTTARRLWRKKTDMMIFMAAWEADKRYNDSGERAMSREVTPSLIQNYISQQREESVEPDLPRQPSVPSESIRPSIETSSIQNQPQRVSIRKQPKRAGRASSNLPSEREQLAEILKSLQQVLSQMSIGSRI